MASNGNQVPDLASVLKTLSGFVPAPYSISKNAENQAETASNPPSAYLNQSEKPRNVPERDQGPTNSWLPGTLPAQTSPNQDIPLPIRQNDCPDPSIITTWPDALKCVMKTVAHSEALQSKIRRLIRTQHQHERQWWEGRKALVAKQEARVEKKRKLDEVLRSVGGTVAEIEISTPEDNLAEIKRYDGKVYKASVDMSRALDSELRALGIPFFAIQHKLVRPRSMAEAADESASPHDNGTERKNIISTEQLAALQRRMLELLEDLCTE